MLALERRKKIEDIIYRKRTVQVAELAAQFEVSMETIRSDLEKLEEKGLIVRTYGGAALADTAEPELGVDMRDIENYEGKQKIGRAAADLIRDGETIFLDASTSSLHLARSIKTKRSLIVITNSVRVVEELAMCDHITTICVGGRLSSRNLSFVGRVSETLIREHYAADKMFFSCRGLTVSLGLMDNTESEAEIKKAMMERAEEIIFLCDNQKPDRRGMQVICGFERLSRAVVEDGLPDEFYQAFSDAGVEVIRA